MENTQTSQRQYIEQKRGRKAWQDVTAIKALNNKELEKKYRSRARSLNAMIQINGLGQTLGFFSANAWSKSKGQEQRKETECYYLLAHLTEWVRAHFTADNSNAMGADYKGLLTWVIDEETTSSDYRRATSECLAFGVWLSRFAEAELEGDES